MFVLLALAATLVTPAQHSSEVPDVRVISTVDARVSEWAPKPAEKRFDEIGWAADIREALRLGREHRRPVFLFTMDGKVNTGRC